LPYPRFDHFRRVTALGREILNLHLARKIFRADFRTLKNVRLPDGFQLRRFPAHV
jgi:hypothetical protein